VIAALVLAMALAQNPPPPPTCAPTDFECLKDWVVYEHYRADTAEENLDAAKAALNRDKHEIERCQKAAEGSTFGWGFAAGALITALVLGSIALASH
jgi:hypothetical protein